MYNNVRNGKLDDAENKLIFQRLLWRPTWRHHMSVLSQGLNTLSFAGTAYSTVTQA